MIRIVLLLVAFLVSALPLQAAPIVSHAGLSGPDESPANASPGSGFAVVTIDDVTGVMQVRVRFSDLIGLVTASHIHVVNGPGDADTTDTLGPVATSVPTFLGFPSGVTFGSYDRMFDMTDVANYRPGWITDSGGTEFLALQELFDGITEGRAYLNIHTSVYQGGEIRGFLQPQLLVGPEPATLLLLGSGLAAIGCRRRRQRS